MKTNIQHKNANFDFVCKFFIQKPKKRWFFSDIFKTTSKSESCITSLFTQISEPRSQTSVSKNQMSEPESLTSESVSHSS